MKIAIVGYYGYNNFGDEINLLEMIKLIHNQFPHAEITVFSRSLYFTFMKPDYHLVPGGGIELKSFQARLNSYDLIVIGGGGLIYFGAHYLTFLDDRIKVPYIISRVGVDDRAVDEKAVEKIKYVLKRASHLTVRTKGDLALLKKHCGISCDVVPEAIWNYRAKEYKLPHSRKNVIVSLNVYSGRFIQSVKKALGSLKQPVSEYTLAMQDTTTDIYYNIKATNPKNRKMIPDSIGLEGKGGCLAAGDLTITSRLHAALVSISHGVPALMLQSTPKLKFLSEEIGLKDWYCGDEISSARVETMLDEKTVKHQRLLDITSAMRKQASANIIV